MRKRGFHILIFFLSFSLLCNSQSDSLVRYYHSNNVVSSVGKLKDGKPIGKWINYYNTGLIKSIGNFSLGKTDSTWSFYSNIGDTLELITFVKGVKSGYHVKYSGENEDNKIVSKELYLDGKLNGTSYYYNRRTKSYTEKFYVNNMVNGISKTYDKDDQVKYISIYKDNKLIESYPVNRTDSTNAKYGKWVTFYHDGNIQKIEEFKDGINHGSVKKYKKNGALESIISYEFGKPINLNESFSDIQIIEEYNDDSVITYQGFYRDSVPVGIHRWYSNGQVSKSIIYTNEGEVSETGIMLDDGTRIGQWKMYYSDERLKAKGSFVNGKKSGRWNYYYMSDSIPVLEQSGSYMNGEPDGEWRWFYKYGEIRRVENYNYGILNGVFLEYDLQGNIRTEGEYIEDLKNGIWKFYTIDYIEEGEYVDDDKDGKWVIKYNNGRDMFVGKYDHGHAEGKHTFYYNNGIIKEERFYESGQKVKDWKKYNVDGELTLTITYRNGREYSINGVPIKKR